MKRAIMFIGILIFLMSSAVVYSMKMDDIYKPYKEKLIRFHVLANSDLSEDQELKLKVRDKVIEFLSPKLEKSKSIEESEKIIVDNIKNIQRVAKKEIVRNNSSYDVSVKLGYSDFPTKKYSDIVLPAGKYKALKVVIGQGKGQNWWCVMFPPLCFIDMNQGITSQKTEDNMKNVLSEKEYNMISIKKTSDIQVRFKIFEIVSKYKDGNLRLGSNKK